MSVLGRKRRGLSNVVTTALMLTAVAVIGTGVVLWSNSNLKTFENDLIISSTNSTNKINESPIIENVVLVPNFPTIPNNAVNVTVTNVGTEGFTVKQIKVSDSTQSVLLPIGTTAIPAHSSALFSYHYQWQSNLLTTIQVTTVRGTVISTQAVHQ